MKVKINSYHRKVSNFIHLLVSVISHYSQRLSADFIEKTKFEKILRNLRTNS